MWEQKTAYVALRSGREAAGCLLLLDGQATAQRHRAAVHQDRARGPVRDVRRARIHPEPAAQLDQRAVIVMIVTARKNARCAKLLSRLRLGARINVHRYTSIYIKRNEVEQRLGTNITVYSRYIYLTCSQIAPTSTCGYPRPFWETWSRSQ